MTTIELTDDMVVLPRSFRRRAAVFSTKVALCVAASVAISEAASIAYGYGARQYRAARTAILAQLTRVEVVREMLPAREVSTAELVATLSREMGINPIVTHAIIEQESGGREDALRFEPHVYARVKGRTDEERRMLASSFGLTQVMGYHARQTCGLKSWAELLQPEKNIRCGLTVLRDNLKRTRRLRDALRMYNGSGERAEAYAEKVLARIGEKLVEG